MRLRICGTCAAALMAVALSFAGPGLAQEARNPGIEATIRNQFDAFLAEDAARAFTFASPSIKQMFGSADRFGMMVQNAYPMVWQPSDVKMLELREVAGALWQRVMVRDAAGEIHMLDYQMIETAEGWQINGVQLLPQIGVGA
ncbi:MAG: hypothetical protein JG765_215 [Cereibacter sp.]|nr:hypothetical protein [Cereibacter sp.]